MKKIAIILMLLASQLAHAGTDTKVSELSENLHKRYPATQFKDIQESEVAGIYRVTMGKNVAYVDLSGKYFFFGKLFDMENQLDLTSKLQAKADLVEFDKLPLKDAIKIKKGNGKRVFAVFSDPDCPYCKQLDSTLSRMDNYTMYLFIYPIESLHPESPQRAKSIWCSSNQAKSWEDWILDGVNPKEASCDNPIQRNIELAQSLGVSGTPTLIHSTGKSSAGAMPRDTLESWLNVEVGK